VIFFNIQKKKVIEHVVNIIDNLEMTLEQKEKIKFKAFVVLDDFILRVENQQQIIHFNTKDNTLAASIIYSAIISDKTLTNISLRDLSKIVGINKETIRENYNKHFRSYHPRSEFLFSAYRFSNIYKVISLYIFNQVRNKDIPTNELVPKIKSMILEAKYPRFLHAEDIKTLKEMFYNYQNTFIKFFTDLIETVKLITFSSRNHEIIKAKIVILSLVRYLEDKGINLLQQTDTFYKIVREIFDHLSSSTKNLFPERLSRAFEVKMSKQEYQQYNNRYRQVVGYRLKLYLLNKLCNGNIKCPECEKEGFEVNTGINRLNALEFHHQTKKKTEIFTAVRLYEIFTENQADPLFLEKMIDILELEEVTVLCRNHHLMIDDYYFQHFNHFINFDKLFSFSAEEIHLLLRVVVDNFRLTKNLSNERKSTIRYRITTRIKKKYIIETLYGKKCILCGEFNTEKHLRSFNFCHQDSSVKTVQASYLFHTNSLPEIADLLRKEKGAYLCSNCHTLYDMEYYNVIDEIYDNKEVSNRVKDDYLDICNRFKPISKTMVRKVKDPLMKTIKIRDNFISFITVIYEFNKANIDATNEMISNHLSVNYSGVKSFFFKRRDFLKRYVNFSYGKPTKYSLNDKGRNLVRLLNYFIQYYRALELDECQDCDLNSEDGCKANHSNECPLIKLGKYLHFKPKDV
jgi:hypothetical protein